MRWKNLQRNCNDFIFDSSMVSQVRNIQKHCLITFFIDNFLNKHFSLFNWRLKREDLCPKLCFYLSVCILYLFNSFLWSSSWFPRWEFFWFLEMIRLDPFTRQASSWSSCWNILLLSHFQVIRNTEMCSTFFHLFWHDENITASLLDCLNEC